MRRPILSLALQFSIAALFLFLLLSGVMVSASAGAQAGRAEAPAGNAVIYWSKVALQAVRLTNPGPPMVARDLAMVHTAQYEAWSQYDATAVGVLLGETLRRPEQERSVENKSIAMSYAAYRVLVDLFPSLRRYFDSSMEELGLDPALLTTDPTTPAGLGNLAAAVLLTYRHADGANQLGDLHPGAYTDYTGYQPANTPTQINDLNHWQPLATPNGSFQGGCVDGNGALITQTYVGPHWGNVLPFALDDGDPITPTRAPAHFPSPEFTLQAREILSISANLTDREKAIAEYWADGPSSELPPGHWAIFSQIVSGRDHHSLDDDAKLFFAVTNASNDAGILAWKLKRIYDYVRPITAIRGLFSGQQVVAWAGPYSGTMSIDGGTWAPYQPSCFVTPAFPEFVSGHSTFSAASAEVLRSFTGSDVFSHSVTVNFSRVEPGLTPAAPVTLHWATFSDAADEAGMSRRYGGIHFQDGDLEGRALGRKVGARVWQKASSFFAGDATPVVDMDEEIAAFIRLDNFERIFRPHQTYLPLLIGR